MKWQSLCSIFPLHDIKNLEKLEERARPPVEEDQWHGVSSRGGKQHEVRIDSCAFLLDRELVVRILVQLPLEVSPTSG